jgi:hypothetical protein
MWIFGKKKKSVNDRMREVIERNRIYTIEKEERNYDVKKLIQAIEKAARESLNIRNKDVKIDYTVSSYYITVITNITRNSTHKNK